MSLDALEFPRVRDLLGRFVVSPLARASLERLAPFEQRDRVERAHAQTRELALYLAAGGRLPLLALADSRPWVSAFLAGERRPAGSDLAELCRAVRSGVRLRKTLVELTDRPALRELGERLPGMDALLQRLEATLDDKGEVLSAASLRLAQLREDVARTQAEIEVVLERLLRTASVVKYLQSQQVVWRHDRPVLQVKPEWRRQVRGIVHDRSQSGQTVFVEPEPVVELTNKLGDLKAAESAEVQRILAELLQDVFRQGSEILRLLDGLAWIDFSHARARLVRELDFAVPDVAADGVFHLRGARHPLLLVPLLEGRATKEEAYGGVVPLDLDLGDPYSMLVVTGPNTGGKTVVLKTLGLLTAMAQAGLPVPASEAALPLVDGQFADIGDEQGVEQSLSTFSSHLRRVQQALVGATKHSLVLLDELGAGTDPEEGAALAWAILEVLHRRGVPTLVSTHLGKLKDFAYEHAGVENGAMAFDPDQLRPLYRLDVGVPGESQALHIARAIGIEPPIVDRARGMLAQRDRRLEEIIGTLERTRRAAEQHRQQAEAIQKDAEGRASVLSEKEAAADRRQTWITEEAEHFVDEELRAARELLREPLKQFLNAPHPYDEKARGMLNLLDGLLSRSSLGRRREQFVAELKKGFVVYVPRFRRRADVVKIDRKRRLLTLKLGDLVLELPFDEVSWLQPLDSP